MSDNEKEEINLFLNYEKIKENMYNISELEKKINKNWNLCQEIAQEILPNYVEQEIKELKEQSLGDYRERLFERLRIQEEVLRELFKEKMNINRGERKFKSLNALFEYLLKKLDGEKEPLEDGQTSDRNRHGINLTNAMADSKPSEQEEATPYANGHGKPKPSHTEWVRCEHFDAGICQIGKAYTCEYQHGCKIPKEKEPTEVAGSARQTVDVNDKDWICGVCKGIIQEEANFFEIKVHTSCFDKIGVEREDLEWLLNLQQDTTTWHYKMRQQYLDKKKKLREKYLKEEK